MADIPTLTFSAMPAAVEAGNATDENEKPTISGIILPYGEIGHTNAGSLTVQAGAVAMPDDPAKVKLLYGHDREKPIGRALALETTDKGIRATFAIGSGKRARRAYADARDGIRDGFSVELESVSVDRKNGRITAGRLSAVALLPMPAYDNARTDIAAESMPEPLGETDMTETPDTPDTATVRAPAAIVAGTHTAPRDAVMDYARTLVSARFDRGDAGVIAALADITESNSGAALGMQAVGELWDGRTYMDKYRVCVVDRPLTGAKVVGWAWTTKPETAAYAGDKAAIPSNAAALSEVSTTASRIAGGHDIDRIHIDLGDPGFMASYWRAMVDSVAMQYDDNRMAAVVANATAGGTATNVGNAYAQALIALGSVDYIAVAADIAAADLSAPADTLPSVLTGGTVYGSAGTPDIVVTDQLTSEVICGQRNAVSFYSDNPPIRIEGVNIPNGGVDAAVFGYWAALPADTSKILSYTVA